MNQRISDIGYLPPRLQWLPSVFQVAGLRALVTCGERGQLHAADVCRLAAEGDDRTQVQMGVGDGCDHFGNV